MRWSTGSLALIRQAWERNSKTFSAQPEATPHVVPPLVAPQFPNPALGPRPPQQAPPLHLIAGTVASEPVAHAAAPQKEHTGEVSWRSSGWSDDSYGDHHGNKWSRSWGGNWNEREAQSGPNYEGEDPLIFTSTQASFYDDWHRRSSPEVPWRSKSRARDAAGRNSKGKGKGKGKPRRSKRGGRNRGQKHWDPWHAEPDAEPAPVYEIYDEEDEEEMQAQEEEEEEEENQTEMPASSSGSLPDLAMYLGEVHHCKGIGFIL